MKVALVSLNGAGACVMLAAATFCFDRADLTSGGACLILGGVLLVLAGVIYLKG